MPPAAYFQAGYYERYLYLLETVLVEKGILTPEQLEARRGLLAQRVDARVPRTTTTEAPAASPVGAVFREGAFGARREVDRPPRFSVGDPVVTHNLHPVGHTRLPRYARGKHGVIDRVGPAAVFPDMNFLGRGENPQHVYTVRFDGRELWGDTAEPNESMRVDLWESYLEAA